MSITVGQILSGKVTGITNFGAFVELETGETGLVHISEVAPQLRYLVFRMSKYSDNNTYCHYDKADTKNRIYSSDYFID